MPSEVPNWTALFHPLQSEVWLAAAVTFICSWLFLYWYCKWHNPGDAIAPRDTLIWMVAFVIDETVPITHKFKSTGIRTFFVLFLFAAFTLTMAYRGILTSEMTVSFPPTPIDTIRSAI